MEWPKFDFAKCSHVRSQRLSSIGKSNSGLKRDHSKVCRSLAADFENIKSRKKESSMRRNITQSENITIFHQQILSNSNSPTCSQGDSFQMNGKVNTERIPPLSPILVNGFLKNPAACSITSLEGSSLNLEEMLTSLRYKGSVDPATASVSHCEDLIAPESSETVFTSPHSESQISTSFVTIAEEFDNLNSKCRKNGKKTTYSPKLHASLSTATSTNAHSMDNSLKFLETLPPPQIDCKNLNRNGSFPNLDVISSQLSFESDESITIRHTRSESDIFQTHTVYIDDSESVTIASEQSRDCFLDITIHEIEPNNPAFDTEPFLQNTSSVKNQLKIYDLQEENDESIHQKQYYRLSKLAEALKKRLFISSSDLAMWKCEGPKQNPVKQVTVISNVEQWGLYWTLVKNVSDSQIAHIVDSEPMKKTMDVISRNRSEKAKNAGDDEGSQRCYDSSSPETFFIYQPLSKLNTSSGNDITIMHEIKLIDSIAKKFRLLLASQFV